MSSKGSSGNVSTTTGPPAWAQPYYTQGMTNAASLYGASPGPTPYPGAQVAPFSPMQEQGLGQVLGLSGSNPALSAAGSEFMNLMSGSGLNPTTNTALHGQADSALNDIQMNAGTQFAGAGRNFNASAPSQTAQMAQAQAQVYDPAYNNSLNQMTQALGQTNNLINAQYLPSLMLGQAGQAVQTQAQNLINQNMNTYNQYQQLPYSQLSNYMSTIAGIPVGKTATQPLYQNNAAAGMGSLLNAASLYGSLGGGGKGAAPNAGSFGNGNFASGTFAPAGAAITDPFAYSTPFSAGGYGS